MPEISRFLGIVVRMYYNEHGTPHLHAVYGKHMEYHVLEARYRGGHVVWLRFRDGTVGEIDLASALKGPVFEPLRDPEYFRRFSIDPQFHTLVWPNGVDIAPEYLHENVRVTA